jgi:hypothetical protein
MFMKNDTYNLFDKVHYGAANAGIYQITEVLNNNRFVISTFPDEREEITVSERQLSAIPSVSLQVTGEIDDELLDKLDTLVTSEPKVVADHVFSLKVMESRISEAEELLNEYHTPYEVLEGVH